MCYISIIKFGFIFYKILFFFQFYIKTVKLSKIDIFDRENLLKSNVSKF